MGDILDIVKEFGPALGGISAVGFGIWRINTRFRPAFAAKVDARSQAMRLEVVNKGRRPGRVSEVAVVDSSDGEVAAEFAGLPDGRFHPATLTHKDQRHLILAAMPQHGPFPQGARIFVRWGKGKERMLQPSATRDAFNGLSSDWPPNSDGG